MSPTITFCGGAGTVTGSCFWIRGGGVSFLVDCGMYQGSKTLKALNYEAFPFNPAELDFALLTHAHIDHSGLIPKLIKNGFSGPVYATEGTRDLVSFMWPDSGYIQETEVRFLNRRNEQRGLAKVEPIYTQAGAEDAVQSVNVVDYEKWIDLAGGVRARFWNAGHILGAASIEIEAPLKDRSSDPLRLLFSGDLGPEHKLFHPDPEGPRDLDYLVCEATYGDRLRPPLRPKERRRLLADEIRQALDGGEGALVIPAFSVERTQELLVDISVLMRRNEIGAPIVFLDSPLAIRATQTFQRHAGALEDVGGDGGLLDNENFVFTKTSDESKRINSFAGNIIIIAASGMCEAGRIRHHLKRRLWNSRATVLMVGYQAPGTLGSLLLAGRKSVKIQGDVVKVRARVRELDIYSGHADAKGLENWVLERLPVRAGLFLTHGDPEALAALRERLVAAGIERDRVVIPKLDETFDLATRKIAKTSSEIEPRIPDEAVARLDWHNDLAQLSLDIVDRLEAAGDEKARQKVLRRLRRALEENG